MPPRRDALLVATAKYDDTKLARLAAPEHDARELARVLTDPEIGAFQSAVCLVDESSFTIAEKIEDFFADRSRDDLLLLYFSCHGLKDDRSELFFAARNTRSGRLQSTSIRSNFVNEVMRRSHSRRQVLLLDCCFSGAFAKGMIAKAAPSMNAGEVFDGSGRVVLTASDAVQVALETHDEATPASLFTRTLVRGLESGEADGDDDGVVSFDDAFEYVRAELRKQGAEQVPRKWAFDVDGKIILGRRGVSRPAMLQRELLDALASPLPVVRLAAVTELRKLVSGDRQSLVLAAAQALRQLAEDDSRQVQRAAEEALRTETKFVNASVLPKRALELAMSDSQAPEPNPRYTRDDRSLAATKSADVGPIGEISGEGRNSEDFLLLGSQTDSTLRSRRIGIVLSLCLAVLLAGLVVSSLYRAREVGLYLRRDVLAGQCATGDVLESVGDNELLQAVRGLCFVRPAVAGQRILIENDLSAGCGQCDPR